jgi:hypothetical protein
VNHSLNYIKPIAIMVHSLDATSNTAHLLDPCSTQYFYHFNQEIDRNLLQLPELQKIVDY